MKNYIVRNCPALNHLSELSLIANDNSLKKCYMQPNFCKDITDCVIKRIVENCKETDKYYSFCLQKKQRNKL